MIQLLIRVSIFFFLTAPCHTAFCQSDLHEVFSDEVPEEIRDLKVLRALRWTDSTGSHLLVSTGRTVVPLKGGLLDGGGSARRGQYPGVSRTHTLTRTPMIYHYLL